jgi:CRISPR-associated protein Cmr6
MKGDIMPSTMIPSMRPVNKAVHEAIGEIPSGAFNFGLYFNKWFYVIDGSKSNDFSKKLSPWSCSVPSESKSSIAPVNPDPIQNYNTSICLFNGKKIGSSKWIRETCEALLTAKLQGQERLAKAFERLSYEPVLIKGTLRSSLVMGLGNEHPTEKGFRFDWTLGIPIIPSSSIKGVVRLAYLVRELEMQEGPDQEDILKRFSNGELPPSAQQIFGSVNQPISKSLAKGEGNSAPANDGSLRGKVVFLDAFPSRLPQLKAEIMNCHYRDYLMEGKRGPTEDQQPNPQKFWAVDRLLADGKPLAFTFHILLAPEIAGSRTEKERLLQAIHAALEEHGLGAKTAIGHGHFSSGVGALRAVESAGAEKTTTPSHPAKEPVRNTWKDAVVSFRPNDQNVTAQSGNLKATGKGKDLIPESLRNTKSFERKKMVNATVEVEAVGNAFRIVKIEP